MWVRAWDISTIYWYHLRPVQAVASTAEDETQPVTWLQLRRMVFGIAIVYQYILVAYNAKSSELHMQNRYFRDGLTQFPDCRSHSGHVRLAEAVARYVQLWWNFTHWKKKTFLKSLQEIVKWLETFSLLGPFFIRPCTFYPISPFPPPQVPALPSTDSSSCAAVKLVDCPPFTSTESPPLWPTTPIC